ncbi:hypothetical protein [Mucilaginibacter sp. CSA2-8R]|uniref:VOC family protein n=1 Tax=Mucilaginibacter sp. CSA2-8R TaxID=3141542 RepID=UPI00315D951F
MTTTSNIRANFSSIILYARDVEKLKLFYMCAFGFRVIEEQADAWVLLDAGHAQLGLHRMGQDYQIRLQPVDQTHNNVKLVFETEQDINEMRAVLISYDAVMRKIITFDGYDYWFCDGEDPEGNLFQLKQLK